MDYELIYDNTKDNLDDIILKIYADFIESEVKDLLTKKCIMNS